ncbi:acyltransferase family protein [Rhizobium sp. Rhizsp82]|uniref:acyltransferase family protein n=1 Tax=Rhizobium sp. Rhizsp82 TaxID=3243057 RepID=UPI0039B58B63
MSADTISSQTYLSIEARLNDVNFRPSGFDYMRIFLAVSVVFWHSYCVSYPVSAAADAWAGPFGYVLAPILPAFFALSGFLVFGSLERSQKLHKFLALRVIRIYPALIVEVLLSALVLGPIVTQFPLSDYFTDREFYVYFLNTIGWIHYLLPGVFLDNPMPKTVNVSMWTVPFELECYIILAAFTVLGYLKVRSIAVLLFIAACAAVAIDLTFRGVDPTPLGHIHGRVLILCFLAGTLVYKFREVIPYNVWLAVMCGAFTVFASRNEVLIYAMPIPMAYVVAFLGLMNPRRSVFVDSGDYSYGVYLYAAPIQQAVVWFLGDRNTWLLNAAVTLPIVTVFAIFSWHAVEKPFIKVKRHIR